MCSRAEAILHRRLCTAALCTEAHQNRSFLLSKAVFSHVIYVLKASNFQKGLQREPTCRSLSAIQHKAESADAWVLGYEVSKL